MKLILIRHGQTTGNQLKLMQGQMDFNLSFEGKQEILQKRKHILKNLKTSEFQIKRIYTSDLKRAYKTANLIFENHGLPITKVTSLREMNFGNASGMNQEQFSKLYPELVQKLRSKNRDWTHKYPKGESYNNIQKRVWNFTKKKINQNIESKKSIIFVSHSTPIKMIIANLENKHDEIFSGNIKPKNIEPIIYDIKKSRKSKKSDLEFKIQRCE